MTDHVTTPATRAGLPVLRAFTAALLDALVLPAGHALQSLHLAPRRYAVLSTAPVCTCMCADDWCAPQVTCRCAR